MSRYTGPVYKKSRRLGFSVLENVVARAKFVEFDANKMTGTYVRYPERSELNADVNESLVVEFYNR